MIQLRLLASGLNHRCGLSIVQKVMERMMIERMASFEDQKG